MGLFRQKNRARGETSNQSPSGQPLQESQGDKRPALPDAPPTRERAGKDLFNFETLAKSEPGSTDQLVANMVESQPFLGELLKASSEEEQVKIIQDKLAPEYYERLLLQLSAIEFHYKEKEKRVTEALSLAKLQYRLATMLPEDDLNPSDERIHSRSRHIADALQSLGSIYVDLGEMSQALDYNLRAEEWYERDAAERKERGITKESAFDQVFQERDVRATLFENTARLYDQLGDHEKTMKYARRAAEIDARRPTNQSRIAYLLTIGRSAEGNGDFDSALGAYHEALDIALADSNSQIVVRDVVTASHHIGSLLAKLRLFRQALRYHQRALYLNSGARHLERMSYDHRALGGILEARPDLGDPLEHYEAAITCSSVPSAEGSPFTWQSSDGSYLQVLDPALAWPSTLAAARVCTERQDYDRAEKFLALTIDLGEVMRANLAQNEYRIGFQAQRMEAYQNMIKLQGQLSKQRPSDDGKDSGPKTRAFAYAERARSRSFLDLLGTSSFSLPSEVPEELRAKEAGLTERLRSLSQSSPTPTSAERQTDWAAYEATRAELEKVWKEIVKLVPAAADYVELRRGRPIKMEDLRELLLP
jgi:tetratricopeptide (TPR) repeat protein